MPQVALFPDIHLRSEHADRIVSELRETVSGLGDRPDHAFVLGDLIQEADDPDVDAAHVETVRETFDDAPFSTTYLLGNHDVENLSHDRLSDLLDQDRFYGTREVDGRSVVFLDSTHTRAAGARGELGSDQREWLERVLADRPGSIVLCHHPLGNFDLSDNVWFSEYPERAYLYDRKEALRLLADADARGTISGHIHQSGFSTFHGMSHVSVNAFSKETPERAFTGTYAVATIDDGIDVDVRVRDRTVTSFVAD
jgi:3',5'-cyclic AMP phosphodiesterase CpdA